MKYFHTYYKNKGKAAKSQHFETINNISKLSKEVLTEYCFQTRHIPLIGTIALFLKLEQVSYNAIGEFLRLSRYNVMTLIKNTLMGNMYIPNATNPKQRKLSYLDSLTLIIETDLAIVRNEPLELKDIIVRAEELFEARQTRAKQIWEGWMHKTNKKDAEKDDTFVRTTRIFLRVA